MSEINRASETNRVESAGKLKKAKAASKPTARAALERLTGAKASKRDAARKEATQREQTVSRSLRRGDASSATPPELPAARADSKSKKAPADSTKKAVASSTKEVSSKDISSKKAASSKASNPAEVMARNIAQGAAAGGVFGVITGTTAAARELTGAAPAQPGAAAVQPGAAAVQPGAAAVQPGAAAVQPGGAAVQPGATAVQPGAAAVQPGATAAQPGLAPVQPAATPAPRGATLQEQQENAVIDRAQARTLDGQAFNPQRDAVAMYEAAEGQWGTDEARVLNTAWTRTPEQLEAINVVYRRNYQSDMFEDVYSDLEDVRESNQVRALRSGDRGRALGEALVDSTDGLGSNPEAFRDALRRPNLTAEDRTRAAELFQREEGQSVTQYAAGRYALEPRRLTEMQALIRGDGGEARRIEGMRQLEGEGETSSIAYMRGLSAEERSGLVQRSRQTPEQLASRLSGPERDEMLGLLNNNLSVANAAAIRDASDSAFGTANAGRIWTAMESNIQDPQQRHAAQRQLESDYNRMYGPPNLSTMVDTRISGASRERTHVMREEGRVTAGQAADFAMRGAEVVDGEAGQVIASTPAAEMRSSYSDATGGRSLASDIETRLSGRERIDARISARGEPRDAREAVAWMRERATFEGSGGFVGAFSDSDDRMMATVRRAESTLQELDRARQGGDTEAISRLQRRANELTGVGNAQVDAVRDDKDAVVETTAMIATGVAAGVAVVATGGLAAPAAALMVGAATNYATRRAMMGETYDHRNTQEDLTNGAIEGLSVLGGMRAGRLVVGRLGSASNLANSPVGRLAASRGGTVTIEGTVDGAVGGALSEGGQAFTDSSTYLERGGFERALTRTVTGAGYGAIGGAALARPLDAGMGALTRGAGRGAPEPRLPDADIPPQGQARVDSTSGDVSGGRVAESTSGDVSGGRVAEAAPGDGSGRGVTDTPPGDGSAARLAETRAPAAPPPLPTPQERIAALPDQALVRRMSSEQGFRDLPPADQLDVLDIVGRNQERVRILGIPIAKRYQMEGIMSDLMRHSNLQDAARRREVFSEIRQFMDAEVAPSFRREHLMRQAVETIARPGRLRQGPFGSCQATSAQYHFATSDPAGFLRYVRELASPEGVATTRAGTQVRRGSTADHDVRGMREVDTLFQASTMEHAGRATYNVDRARGEIGFEGGGRSADGLADEEVASLMSEFSGQRVLNESFLEWSGTEWTHSVNPQQRAVFEREVQRAAADGRPLQASLSWGDGPAGHAIVVEGVSDEGFIMRNSHSGSDGRNALPSLTGREGPTRTALDQEGRSLVPKDTFFEQLTSYRRPETASENFLRMNPHNELLSRLRPEGGSSADWQQSFRQMYPDINIPAGGEAKFGAFLDRRLGSLHERVEAGTLTPDEFQRELTGSLENFQRNFDQVDVPRQDQDAFTSRIQEGERQALLTDGPYFELGNRLLPSFSNVPSDWQASMRSLYGDLNIPPGRDLEYGAKVSGHLESEFVRLQNRELSASGFTDSMRDFTERLNRDFDSVPLQESQLEFFRLVRSKLSE